MRVVVGDVGVHAACRCGHRAVVWRLRELQSPDELRPRAAALPAGLAT